MTEYQFFTTYGIDYSIDEIWFIENVIDKAHREIKEGVFKKTPKTKTKINNHKGETK